MRLCRDNNQKDHEAFALITLGRVVAATNRMKFEEARELILQGIKLLQTLGHKPQYATGLFRLGELYANVGRKEEALENLKKAEVMFQEMGMDYWLGKTQELLAAL